MSTPRRSRAEAKADTRTALLRTCAEVFAERGFTAASVEEIAERAGFTRGAFYANFADKADALLTVLDESMADDMVEAAELIATTPDEEKLAALQGWYDGMRIRSTEALQRALDELAAHPAHAEAVRVRRARRQADTRAVIAASVRGYREASGVHLALDDDTIAMVVLAIGDGVALQRHADPSAIPADLFTTAVAYLWLGTLTGPPTIDPPAPPGGRSTRPRRRSPRAGGRTAGS
jgi:AcrR family transcriptional regulator